MSDERLKRTAWLSGLARRDRDVQTMIAQVCSSKGERSLGELAMNHPEVLDELVEVVEDLLDQMPTDNRPGYLR